MMKLMLMIWKEPVQSEFFQVREVTGNILKGSISDSWTPRHIEAHLEGKTLHINHNHSLIDLLYDPVQWGILIQRLF